MTKPPNSQLPFFRCFNGGKKGEKEREEKGFGRFYSNETISSYSSLNSVGGGGEGRGVYNCGEEGKSLFILLVVEGETRGHKALRLNFAEGRRHGGERGVWAYLSVEDILMKFLASPLADGDFP